MMNKISDFIFDSATGFIKLLIVLVSISIGAYNFIMDKFDEKTDSVKAEIVSMRNADVNLINVEIKNINEKIDIGFSEMRQQNKVIINHLLRR